MIDRAALVALLRERSLTFGDFTLASGTRSTYYIDARRTTMSAEGQALIGPLGLAAIRGAGWTPRAVGGLTMGADPIAYAIARASVEAPPRVDAFSVRKESKEHGTRRRIEGNFAPGTPVVVLSNYVTPGIRDHCLRLGAAAAFDKNTEMEAFKSWCTDFANGQVGDRPAAG